MTEPYLLADPHAYLGAHKGRGGVVVRAYRPDAESVRVLPMGIELEPQDGTGVFEGVIPDAKLPLAYELEVRYPAGETYTLRDPYSFMPTVGELDLHLAGEGRHEELYRPSRCSCPRAGRRRRGQLRGVGAERTLGERGRRVQRLGRPPPPDALARRVRDLGALPAGRRAGRPVQVRDPRPGRQAAAQGRPARVPDGGAAEERLDRAPDGVRMAGRRLARAPPRSRRAHGGRSRSTRCISDRGG